MPNFSDIENYWAKEGIVALSDRQIIKGYPNGTFRPEATITRAEFAALLLRVFPEAKAIRDPIKFTDVPENHWAKKAINFASSRGLFTGYPGQFFRPEKLLPRVQAIVVLANGPYYQPAANIEETLEFFEDAAFIPNYAKEAVAGSTKSFLVVNYPNLRKLRPNDNATRGEIAALISQGLRIADAVPLRYIPGVDLLVIKPQYDRVWPFSEGVASVTVGEKKQAIDKTGKVLFEPEVEKLDSFYDGLALGTSGDNKYFFDKNGEVKFQFDLPGEYRYNFANGLVVMRQFPEFKYGYMDLRGEVAIAPQFQDAQTFSEGLAAVLVNGKVGYIDATGEFVLEPKYLGGGSFSEGVAWVTFEDDKKGWIDRRGKFTEVKIDSSDRWGYLIGEPRYISDGMSLISMGNDYYNKTFGFIDTNGRMAIEPKYDFAYDFSEGVAPVEVGGSYVFIDKTENVVIPGPFQRASPFSEGLALVRLNDKFGFIDRLGDFVIAPQFDCASSFAGGMAAVNIGGTFTRYMDSLHKVDRQYFCGGGKWGFVVNPM